MLISPAKLCTEETVQVLDLKMLLMFNRTNMYLNNVLWKAKLHIIVNYVENIGLLYIIKMLEFLYGSYEGSLNVNKHVFHFVCSL